MRNETPKEQRYMGVYDIDPEVFVRQYKRDREMMWTVYDIMDIKPWRFEFDDTGHVTECLWSDSYRHKLGFEDETDFPNAIFSLMDQVHEDDRQDLFDLWYSVVENPSKTFSIEYRCYKKDGTMRWFHSVGKEVKQPKGQPRVFIGLSRDITEEKLHMETLEEQYEIVDALSKDYLNVFMVDMNKKTASIVKLDGYVTEGFGDKSAPFYPYEPFSLKYINDRVYPEDRPAVTEAMNIEKVREMLSKNSEYVYSYRAVDGDEVHFYQFTYIKLEGKNGNERVIAG
ncbi:MAG: PAS domain-containing protein, partial [Lachnospiraceae bacterium]|nr:PAS domain-containing protein [Lachnospiraceae bacterium]